MLTTDYRDGAPNWVDVAAPDISRAAGFYRDLFGWEYHPGGERTGGAVGQRDQGADAEVVGPRRADLRRDLHRPDELVTVAPGPEAEIEHEVPVRIPHHVRRHERRS